MPPEHMVVLSNICSKHFFPIIFHIFNKTEIVSVLFQRGFDICCAIQSQSLCIFGHSKPVRILHHKRYCKIAMRNSLDVSISFVLHCINTYDSLHSCSLEFIGGLISTEIHMSMKHEVKLNAITIFSMCIQCSY